MRISNIKVHFQISAGSQINAGGVYFKFDRVHLVFNREKMVKKWYVRQLKGIGFLAVLLVCVCWYD